MNLLCVNTGGVGDLHGLRMRRLAGQLSKWDITYLDIDKKDRRSSSSALWSTLSSRSWDLVYQESTGLAGGLNMIRAARTRGQKYVVSSGDPISGFFRTIKGPAFGRLFELYERELYRRSAGFIGWTPYLTGRAIEMGAPRGVTVEGAIQPDLFRKFSPPEREVARRKYGVPDAHIVCGVVGSLLWTPRQQYCYGLELIETLKHLKRTDVSLLIVGDGTGRAILEERVPDHLRNRVVFTGRLPENTVVEAMNAMDIGFITQTLDTLGSFRLTTKMPEYLACGLPIAVSPIPGFFDYVGEAGWALPPYHPASPIFAERCALWLDSLCREEIDAKAKHSRSIAESRFAYDVVGPRFVRFIDHLMTTV
jgi:glycosyltransferase involved in cell wall biosynthesis